MPEFVPVSRRLFVDHCVAKLFEQACGVLGGPGALGIDRCSRKRRALKGYLEAARLRRHLVQKAPSVMRRAIGIARRRAVGGVEHGG